MSDDFSSPNPPEPTPPGEPTVMSSGLGAPEPAHELTATVESNNGGGKRIALIVGIVAIVGAGFFAAFTLLSNQGNTPAAGATDFMESLAAEDLLGASENLLPAERRFLAEPLFGWIEELERLGVLGDVNTSDVQGLTIDLSDMTYVTEDISEGLAWVSIEGDMLTGVTPDQLPLGTLFDRYMPPGIIEAMPTSVESGEFGDEFGLALVEQDGTWYVSIMHTIAEAGRRASDTPFPETAALDTPQGASSPEAALENLFTSMFALDVRSMLDVTDPDETLAFRSYSGLFFADWETALADARSELAAAGVSFGVDEVTVESKGSGDDLVAWVTDVPTFHMSIDIPGMFSASVERSAGCLTVFVDPAIIQAFAGEGGTGDLDLSQFDGVTCIEMPAQQNPADQDDMADAVLELVAELPVIGTLIEAYTPADGSSTPQVEFQMTEQGGAYFVSPFGTTNRWMRSVTAPLTEEALITIGDELQAISEDPDAAMEDFLAALSAVDPNGPLAALMDGVMSGGGFGTAGAPLPPTADETTEVDVDTDGDLAYGADVVAPYADAPALLLVFQDDIDAVAADIEALFGPGAVLTIFTGPSTHQLLVDAYGEDGTYGLEPEDFPSGLHIAALDIDALVTIINWDEILDLYSAGELGL